MKYSELTNEQVLEVRRRISAGEPFEKLAKEYNVMVKDISDCVNTGRRMPWSP